MAWGRIAKAAWISLALTSVGFAVAKANWFGFQQSSGDFADDVSQRLGLVSYRRFGDRPDSPRAGRDRVRVIHVDDEGLTSLTEQGWPGWPPGYDDLAIMIDDVARNPGGQPARAVFVDLEVTQSNRVGGPGSPSDQEFLLMIKKIGEITGARATTVGGREGWMHLRACRHDPLMKLACMVEWMGTPVIMPRGEGVAVEDPNRVVLDSLQSVVVLAPTLVNVRNYRMAQPVVGRSPDAAGSFELYPAAAAYAAHCLVEQQMKQMDVCGVPAIYMAGQAAAALRSDPDARPRLPTWNDLEPSWKAPLAVVWSSDQSPLQKALWSQTSEGTLPECRSEIPLWDRLVEQAGRDRGPATEKRQACAYTLMMGYDRLVAGFGLNDRRDYPNLLGDKLIVLGVQFRSSDWVPTPLHGSLPGVHYHAMALDNLLEMGPRYRRSEQGLGRADLFTLPLTFLLLLGVNLASMLRRDRIGEAGTGLSLRVAFAWYGTLIAVIVIGSALYIWLLSGLWADVVVNWLGVFMLVFGAVWFAAREDLRLDISAQLRRSRTGARIDTLFARLGRSLDRHSRPDE